jgi:SAM-dependent methyltransferase
MTSTSFDRQIGLEFRKSLAARSRSGFMARYLGGTHILDIGYRGGDPNVVPITETAIGVDLDYPGYDGMVLPFRNGSQDAVLSSHCLEHMSNPTAVIQEWYRVLKVGGYIVTIVPHQHLYEKKFSLPSNWSAEHLRFYTPASLLGEFEAALPINGYRVRHLADNDAGYDYTIGPTSHSAGCYEIELVVEKIPHPVWGLA